MVATPEQTAEEIDSLSQKTKDRRAFRACLETGVKLNQNAFVDTCTSILDDLEAAEERVAELLITRKHAREYEDLVREEVTKLFKATEAVKAGLGIYDD